MPELPDVEGFKQHLDATCRGRTIRTVAVADDRVLDGISAAALARRLEGSKIGASRRHGKHLFVEIGSVGWLALHFGMNGYLAHFVGDAEDPPYDRVRLDFADGHHLAYVNPRLLGHLGLVPDVDAFVAAEGLGPDALARDFDVAWLERALAGSRRDVKSLLMDQAVVAGIGNIYSDEILFQARLDPRIRCDRLDGRARRRLFDAIKHVLETAVEAGAGSERLADRLPRGFLTPQRKKSGRCPRCGGLVETLKLAGRTAYFCPRCQSEPG